MKEQLQKLLAEKLGRDENTIGIDDDVMADLGFDSLECAELICEIEDTFNVVIPDELAPEMRTVRTAAETIDELLQK